jgi:hypothetical protein
MTSVADEASLNSPRCKQMSCEVQSGRSDTAHEDCVWGCRHNSEEVEPGTSTVVLPAWPWACLTYNHNKRKGTSSSPLFYLHLCSLSILSNHLILSSHLSNPTFLFNHPLTHSSSHEYYPIRRWLSSGLLRRVLWWKLNDVSEVLATSIIRSLSLLNPEGSHFHTPRRENLKSRITHTINHYSIT